MTDPRGLSPTEAKLTDYKAELWGRLLGAQEEYEGETTWVLSRLHARGCRDGLLTAYSLLTDQDEETVYENVQEALTARAEIRAQREP